MERTVRSPIQSQRVSSAAETATLPASAAGGSGEQGQAHEGGNPQHHPGAQHVAVGPVVGDLVDHHHQRGHQGSEQQGAGATLAGETLGSALAVIGGLIDMHHTRVLDTVGVVNEVAHGR